MLVVSGSVRTEQPNEIFFDNLEIIPEADIAQWKILGGDGALEEKWLIKCFQRLTSPKIT